MEPTKSAYGSRSSRALTLDEATKALMIERNKEVSRFSWMNDYKELIVAKIKRNTGVLSIPVTLGGRLFMITPLSARFPGEYHISPVGAFVPCATFKLESLERYVDNGSNY